MSRSGASVSGVLVLDNTGGGLNADAWKKDLQVIHEAPDSHGRTKTVEFENGVDETSGKITHINYWVV